jgi:hypothetical protein
MSRARSGNAAGLGKAMPSRLAEFDCSNRGEGDTA